MDDKQFQYIIERFNSLDKRIDSLDKQFNSLDKRIDSLDKQFNSLDKRIDHLSKRIDYLDQGFDNFSKRINSLEEKVILRNDDVFTKMDAVYKEVIDIRQEQSSHQAEHDRMQADLDEIKRIPVIAHELKK